MSAFTEESDFRSQSVSLVEMMRSWRCCVASLASGDFDHPTLLSGPLKAIRELVEGENPYESTPSNFWPHDRTWFVWTDWDLWATKISGSPALIDAVRAEPDLETINWPA